MNKKIYKDIRPYLMKQIFLAGIVIGFSIGMLIIENLKVLYLSLAFAAGIIFNIKLDMNTHLLEKLNEIRKNQ